MPSDAETDAELASRLATQAGHVLLELRAEMFAAGASTWDVKDAGDALAQKFLAEELGLHRPDDAVLSEEGLEDPRRFTSDRVWIVDPLDGTREFSEPGRHDWAVHVALWDRRRLRRVAVSLPAVGRDVRHRPGPGRAADDRDRPRVVTSRTRAPYAAVLVAEALGCDAVRLGSAGAKAMAVVLGEADIYVHDGGMYQWDSAAPAAVALAAGLHASRLDGSPLVYNERDPWLPDFIVCRPELAEAVHHALWGVTVDRRGAHRDPLRGRPPRRHGLARPSPPPQRVDGPDARRVPLDDRRARTRDDVRAVVVTGHAAGVLRRRRLQGARGPRRPWRLRLRSPARRRPGPAAATASTPTSPGSSAIACRSSPRSTAPAPASGWPWPLFCDLRFVAATAKITTAAPKLGLPAEYGMSWILPRLVGADAGQRPAAVRPRGHRRGDRRLGAVERACCPTATPRSTPPSSTPPSSPTTTGPHARAPPPSVRSGDRPAPPRSGGVRGRLAPPARRG